MHIGAGITMREVIPKVGIKFDFTADDFSFKTCFIEVVVFRDLRGARSLYMAQPI